MTTDPAALVTEFCARWANPDLEQILSYFTDDAVYVNIPMPPAQGREAIRELLVVMLEGFDGIDFTVHRQVAQGSVVLNERTDVMRRTDGARLGLPAWDPSRCVTGGSPRGGITSIWAR